MTAEAPIETPSAAGRPVRYTPSRYTGVAIVLHWLIAAAIVFQIILGSVSYTHLTLPTKA